MMTRASDFDFDELGYYVDRLAENGAIAEARERYTDIIAEMTAALPDAKRVSKLVLECDRFAAWGGSFDGVRAAFTDLLAMHAGLHGAYYAKAEAREVAAAHGRRGGRPPTGYDGEWLNLFNERQARNPALSAAEICRRIAAIWSDETGASRGWRTIFDGVRRAQSGS